LGNTTNNVAEAYAPWKGIKIARIRGFQKLIILGDSMIVIRSLINHTNSGNKATLGAIARDYKLLMVFDEYKVFHIK
jgi:ribonuclease HI